jgi:hypothetical protein
MPFHFGADLTGIDGRWLVSVLLPGGYVLKRTVPGTRKMAEKTALSLIDTWLERRRAQQRKISN